MKLKISFILLIALYTIMGCEKTPDEITSSFQMSKNVGFIDYSMMVEFVNASDPNSPPTNVNMVIEGEGAAGILESGGEKNFKVVDGKIYLIVNPNAKPAESKPLNFSIKATADGYLPVNYEAHVKFGEKQQIISIPMVNLSAPPTGVAHSTQSFSLNGGTLVGSKSVVVQPSGDKITGTTVNLPAGTAFYDIDGNKLSGSELKVGLTHFDAQGEAALASFPGGLTPDKVIGESGNAESIFFATAGFASIDMSVGGTKVKGFDKPVAVSMSVSSLTNNLDTNKGIAAGDIIPIWSYDVESGVWQYEEPGTVVLENGELKVNFDVTHLSWYNLDFYGASCPTYTTTCGYQTYRWYNYFWYYYTCTYKYTPPTGKITIVSNNPEYEGRYGEVVLANSNSTLYYSQRVYDVKNGSVIQFYNAPQQLCKFKIYSGTSYYNKGSVIAETAAFSPCTSQVVLNVPLPAPIKLSLKATCFNNTKTLLPSFYVYYKATDKPYYDYLTYVDKGKASTNKLEIGKTYDFIVYYNGRSIKFKNTVTTTDNVFSFTLDDQTCSKIF